MAFQRFRKFRYIIVIALVISGSFALQRWTSSADIITINGEKVAVIDGDSFKSNGEEYRIYGIDAPEYRQLCKDAKNTDWSCGKAARTGLESHLAKGEYSCSVHSRDQYGRSIVTCLNGADDLGANLVEQGFAISGDNFDTVIYAREEALAEKEKRGIWQGEFEKPVNWRARHPR